MKILILLGWVLGLCGVVWVMGDWKSWSISSASRRILGGILVSAWVVLLATRYLAAAVLTSGHGPWFDNSLENIGPVLPVLAWLSLMAGVLLLCDRKVPKPVEAPKSDDTVPTEPS